MSLHNNRLKKILQIKLHLEKTTSPRLQMLLIVSITGAAGFLASFGLLQWEVNSIPLRYLISVLISYLTFLFLLWLWIQSKNEKEDHSVNLDIFPDSLPISSPSSSISETPFQGGTGEFGGGGAGGTFDSNVITDSFEDKSFNSIPEIPLLEDADDFAIPLFVIILLLSLLVCSFWIISSAPLLFAELLLDGAFSIGLYHRLSKIQTRHWLETALKRTALPFFTLGLIFVLTGFAIQLYSPQSKSLGELIERWNQKH